MITKRKIFQKLIGTSFENYDDDTSSVNNQDDASFVNNEDDTFSVTSSLDFNYRYSDSEADSIPDDFGEDDCDGEPTYDNLHYLLNDNLSQNKRMCDKLRIWAVEFHIHQNALQELLKIINENSNLNLPTNPRIVLNTPKSTNVINMDTGEYCHIGLTKAVQQIVSSWIALGHTFDTIPLLINIDGAPITGKSSAKGIWTVLCKEKDYKGVYVVGLYYGTGKPNSANDFLQNFTDEAITYDTKQFNIKIHGFICDAPAKAYILNTKYHGGYFSCSKCGIKGKYYSSVCFPVASHKTLHDYCNVLLRTDLKNLK